MSIRNLDALFTPRSIAVIGASNRPRSVGSVVMRNMLAANFPGPVMPVNPKQRAVAGVFAYPSIAALPDAPDLGVVCTPPQAVPGIIEELGARGARAAVVLTAGLTSELVAPGITLAQRMLEAAQPTYLRVLGPNCLGIVVPGSGIDASFARTPPLAGRIAFISQSGALGVTVLDWARTRGIGFSHFVSLGDGLDVDFGDLLDFLGAEASTKAILLYIEAIRNARKFMSAARAAARNKPVLVVKSGRFEEGARAAASHTGALAGADPVFDAAFRRAGMLRVLETEELFDAVETLAHSKPLQGDRLCILTNGGGPGVMATDVLMEGGGRLAQLPIETVEQLDAVLPNTWSRQNPVDVIGDATVERYAAAMRVLAQDENVDALLVMYVPTAVVSGEDVAGAVIEAARSFGKPLLTCWMGGQTVAEGRRLFSEAGIATYETPDQAVKAFLHLVRYRENQELLMETPPSFPDEPAPDIPRARHVIQANLEEGRTILGEQESKELLAAYGIPVIQPHTAATPGEAGRLAEEVGLPVALKILSPDITHKSDVGGVALNLTTAEAVVSAAESMLSQVAAKRPEALLLGFTVQQMADRKHTHEVIVGIASDAIFGPVILFGHGGTAVEVIADRAVALPPLNMVLARDLVNHTRIAKLLRGYRDTPPANLDELHATLVRVSQMVVDLPEIQEMDVNPLLVGPRGVLALDARIGVARNAVGTARLAIRPYPKELEECAVLRNGRRVLLRPIRPEDALEHHNFHAKLTPEDIRFRFFDLLRTVPHSQMARFTQIDYDREMAFIAKGAEEHALPETLGVVRIAVEPGGRQAEFAIIVRSDIKGQKLGYVLLDKVARYCRDRGLETLVGRVLRENSAMLDLARSLGFKSRNLAGEDILEVRLELNPLTSYEPALLDARASLARRS